MCICLLDLRPYPVELVFSSRFTDEEYVYNLTNSLKATHYEVP